MRPPAPHLITCISLARQPIEKNAIAERPSLLSSYFKAFSGGAHSQSHGVVVASLLVEVDDSRTNSYACFQKEPVVGCSEVVRSAPRIQRELLAGIEGITLRSLRKMFASRLVQAGEPIFTVSKLIGHASVVTMTTH
jgi:hypothetical protein